MATTPNVLTAIMPKILARGLLTLREMCMMPRLVNSDYSADAAKFGSTIDVPVPTAQAATDVTPAEVPPAPSSKTPTTVQIPLDKWKKTDFHLSDKDLVQIDKNQSFYPMQAAEAIRALANQVNSDIFANYKGVYGYTGTAGTTPFGIGSGNFAAPATDATNLRKVLNQQVAPLGNRRAVLDFSAGANALSLPAFSNVAESGDGGPKIQGTIGRKYGLDWYEDDIVPTHTAGTITTGLIAKAATAQAAGLTTIVATTAAGSGAVALKTGDIILFAGDSQTYAVTADATQAVAATDVNISISPAKKVALVGSEAITVKASHVVNLGFHRDAFAFANRPMGDLTMFTGGSEITQLTDPITGISIALEVSRQHHQTVWEFSMLYGSKLVRPELAARLAG